MLKRGLTNSRMLNEVANQKEIEDKILASINGLSLTDAKFILKIIELKLDKIAIVTCKQP